MAEIALPPGDLDNPRVDFDQNYQVNRSAWTGGRRISSLPGVQKWYGSFDVECRTEEEERPWRAFLISLRGPHHWFRLPVACSQRTGANPTVRTGATSGETIPLEGLPGSQAVLGAGQYLTVPLPSGHHRLVMLTAPLVTNGSGQGTASFLPRLNEVPAAGTAVESVNPYMAAALIEPRQGWQLSDGVSSFKFDVEEAL